MCVSSSVPKRFFNPDLSAGGRFTADTAGPTKRVSVNAVRDAPLCTCLVFELLINLLLKADPSPCRFLRVKV